MSIGNWTVTARGLQGALGIWMVMATAGVAVAADRFELDNGMQIVTEENHASPMIAAMVFVKAGAKYESPENNGVTHFLEHLLFNGTAQRSQEQLEPVIDLFGGYINAFTQ
jgi:predicted Zn-dependent peptidase